MTLSPFVNCYILRHEVDTEMAQVAYCADTLWLPGSWTWQDVRTTGVAHAGGVEAVGGVTPSVSLLRGLIRAIADFL